MDKPFDECTLLEIVKCNGLDSRLSKVSALDVAIKNQAAGACSSLLANFSGPNAVHQNTMIQTLKAQSKKYKHQVESLCNIILSGDSNSFDRFMFAINAMNEPG